jgi:hypothetical protein
MICKKYKKAKWKVGVGEVNDEIDRRKDVIRQMFSEVPGSYKSGITLLAATNLYFYSEPWWLFDVGSFHCVVTLERKWRRVDW